MLIADVLTFWHCKCHRLKAKHLEDWRQNKIYLWSIFVDSIVICLKSVTYIFVVLHELLPRKSIPTYNYLQVMRNFRLKHQCLDKSYNIFFVFFCVYTLYDADINSFSPELTWFHGARTLPPYYHEHYITINVLS